MTLAHGEEKQKRSSQICDRTSSNEVNAVSDPGTPPSVPAETQALHKEQSLSATLQESCSNRSNSKRGIK